MSKEPRDRRIPIMMSSEELEAIDNWRFQNRIATRADAIRRLCLIGLSYDEAAAQRPDTKLSDALRHIINAWASVVNVLRGDGEIDRATINAAASEMYNGRLDVGAARYLIYEFNSKVFGIRGAETEKRAVDLALEQMKVSEPESSLLLSEKLGPEYPWDQGPLINMGGPADDDRSAG